MTTIQLGKILAELTRNGCLCGESVDVLLKEIEWLRAENDLLHVTLDKWKQEKAGNDGH
jgi:hypothetical protein